MNIRTWCWRDISRFERLSKATGKSISTIKAYAKGARRVPADHELLTKIEVETGFQVMRHDMRPDAYPPPAT
ncbi:hypothetical protein [Nevskia ramosa]|uniref:hypothetical protein n=1 Tax=Nevskia ramosa TaxID=64002 RepID=UPI003D133EED